MTSREISVGTDGKPKRLVRFGVFEADLRACELRKGGVRIKLQQQPFQLLALLLERRGEILSREELREKLWPEDTFVDFDHSLGTAINKIRQTLGDSADSPRFVETVPRRGYRFIAPVEELPAEAPAGGHACGHCECGAPMELEMDSGPGRSGACCIGV